MARQREKGITRFNVTTGLRSRLKFVRFQQRLQIEPFRAYGLLCLFWDFVAENRAMTGSIADVESWAIARHCEWSAAHDGSPELLIQALKFAAFVSDGVNYPEEPEGTVHDWFEHQPLAREVLRGRSRREGEEEPPTTSAIRPPNVRDEKPMPSEVISTEEHQLLKLEQRFGETIKAFENDWNLLAEKCGVKPVHLFVKGDTARTRRKNICRALVSGEFKPDVVIAEIPECPRLLGDNQIQFTVSFDWLFRKKEGIFNYVKVQDGEWRSKQRRSAEPGREKLHEWGKGKP